MEFIAAPSDWPHTSCQYIFAQSVPPAKIGETVKIDPHVPFRGWASAGFSCKEDFSVCGHAMRKGNIFYVIKTNPVNYRAGRRSAKEPVIGVTRHVMAKGETTSWNCYIDDQSPLIVFVPSSRRTARAVVLDKGGNFVEVVRALRQPNWCEFDTE